MGMGRDWDHLEFTEIKDTGKTKVWEISSLHGDYPTLGVIKWHGAWRKYCFFPYSDTLFDTYCMEIIIGWIKEEMRKRKEKQSIERTTKEGK